MAQREPLHILLVASSYLPAVGGLETVTASLARGLLGKGEQIAVLAQRYPRTLPESESIQGVPVRRFLFLMPRLGQLARGRLDLFAAGLIYFPLTLLRLLRLLWRERPDVVNLQFLGAPALFLIIAHRILRFRYIVSLHGDDVEGLARGTGLDRWVFRASLRQADGVTACTRALLSRALAVVPEARAKASVVYNGIEAKAFAQTAIDIKAAHTFLAVGRMVPIKGFDVLLRAVSLCAQTGSAIRLEIVGDGPERSHLDTLAHNLQIADRIHFRGVQEHDAVLRWMQQCDVIVIPSRQESFGLVALEGLSAGKPIVASKVGGLPEVLEGADAILVDPDNASALAQALNDMLDKIKRDPSFGRRNAQLAARFSETQMVDSYSAVWSLHG